MFKCPACGCDVLGASTVCPNCGNAVGGSLLRQPGSLQEQLQRLLAEGKKIEAIKIYRENTGVGLAEAKSAVEAIARGERGPLLPIRTPGDPFTAQLLSLLQNGQKLAAVKLYRDRTGSSLLDAKTAVESLQAGGALATPQSSDELLAADILPALRMGEKEEAIRLYRKRTGPEYEYARRQVEALARQHGIAAGQSGCLVTALLLLILGSLLIFVAGLVFVIIS